MLARSFSLRTVCAGAISFAFAAPAVAQCPPVTTHYGFHEEFVGTGLATDGELALFGHSRGANCGLFQHRRNDLWPRVVLMGGGGTGVNASGNAVDLRGDIALLGDEGNYSLPGHSPAVSHGAAVVYERSGSTWSRVSDLYPPTPVTVEAFGGTVAIADDQSRVAATARVLGSSGGTEVHVFVRQAAGWNLEQIVSAGGNPSGGLALANGLLFVGTGTQVEVFAEAGGVWSPSTTLAPPTLTSGVNFGARIARSGTDVVISAPQQTHVGSTATGTVFVYDLTLPNWATQPVEIVPSPSAPVVGFGRALDIENDRLAIGASNTAFEYRRTAGGWQRFATVSPPSYGFSQSFGGAVALYPMGLLVGDPYHDDDPWSYPDSPGGVHAFDLVDYGQPFRGCGRGLALETGGSLRLEIVWPAQAGKAYQVFGSISGLGPIAVAGISIPLTPDAYTSLLLLEGGNAAFLPGNAGVLDAAGQATVTWQVPPGLPLFLDGLQFHHALIAYDAMSLAASNAVTSELVRL